ncbi:hypothetical protein C4J81_14700 [Deltaproteobacteria bacterium Smac51]|nr:hypothetical protein C4J81_14700 [Deltaproteobacteria bacterium Smac51]
MPPAHHNEYQPDGPSDNDTQAASRSEGPAGLKNRLESVLRGPRAGFAGLMAALAVLWTAMVALSFHLATGHIPEREVNPPWLFLTASHLAFWVPGLLAVYFGGRHMAKWLRQRDAAEAEMHRMTDGLEKTVAERTESLLLRQQQLQTFMDNTRAGVFLKDKDLQFVMVNRRFADLLGVEPEELIGTQGYHLLSASTAFEMDDLEQRVIHECRVIEEEKQFEFLDKNLGRTYIVSIFPVINHLGQLEGTGGTLVDLTERHKLELELIRARDSAETASRAKSAFLANISHEIRTPLNGVIGMADLLLRSDLNPDQASMAATVKNAGDALLVVLNDILDLSKIEAGKMSLEYWPFSLRNVIFEAVRGLAPIAYTKKLEIIVNISPKTRDGFIGDQNRLRQIILNLVSNALKFTNRGEVTVKVETLEEDEDKALLRFSVTDTGIGIAREKQEIIFEAFEQADSSTTRYYGGTGLGLAISFRLAAMMGARLCLSSEVNLGSCFWFDLELPRSSEPPARWPKINSNVFAGLTVLFVDDNETNRRIILEQLRDWNISANSAAGVDEAMDILETAAACGQSYNLVLSDLQMPGKDGADLIRLMKRDHALAGIPVILLSSVTLPDDGLGGLPFSANLMKPVRPEELMRAMAMALGLWERFGSPDLNVDHEAKVLPQTSSCRLRVLLTEDMEMNQVVAVRQLTALGHEVTVAGDGAQALAEIRDQRFDMIFMDIQMPVMDGLETTSHIRAMERERGWPRTPIISMTAHALKGDREKYLSLGLDGYLSKPILINEMAALIEEMISAFNLTGFASGPAPAGPAQRNEVTTQEITTIIGDKKISFGSSPAAATDKEGPVRLDENLIKMSLGLNSTLVEKSMELYMRDAPALLNRVAEALLKGSPVEAATDAHALKGISGYYTSGRLIDRIKELEKSARYSTWPDDQGKLLEMTDNLRILVLELIDQMKMYLSAGRQV